jgi:hypothetical protein
MVINKYPHLKYTRYVAFGGKTIRYECNICHNSTKTYRGIQSHIKRKHQDVYQKLRRVLPSLDRKQISQKQMRDMLSWQPCPYCKKMLRVPLNKDQMKCTNINCEECIKIVDGKLVEYPEYKYYSSFLPCE